MNNSLSTRIMYKTILKNFYQYLLRDDPSYLTIELILKEFLSGKNSVKHRLPGEILNTEDISKLMVSVNSPRDKALIAFLADTGARISEVLSCKRKNISYEDGDMYITIEEGSKHTSGRKILLIPSVPYLSAWLNYSPFKDPEDYIFVGLDKKNYGKQLCYSAINKVLHTAKRRSGIKKCCSPHAFRRASATNASSYLTDTSLMIRYGWRNRETISVYTKLNPKLVDEGYRRMYGKSKKELNESKLLKPTYCRICRTLQNNDSTICNTCGNPLNKVVERFSMDEKMNKIFEQRPDVVEFLAKIIKEIENK